MASDLPPRTVPTAGAAPLDSEEAAQRIYAGVPAPARAALQMLHLDILSRCPKSTARMEALRKLMEVGSFVKRAFAQRGGE